MIFLSSASGRFEFVRVASLRAAQLMRGCTPRVPAGHKHASTAQRETLEGKVAMIPRVAPSVP